ncbi:MAG TPA: PQQ-binding-like beta-propeller repeat protein [Clostridiaceae bacterium]|nr:PQQ-binding-like beta-propeller repeat protein [Clostridiaceae bacterium]
MNRTNKFKKKRKIRQLVFLTSIITIFILLYGVKVFIIDSGNRSGPGPNKNAEQTKDEITESSENDTDDKNNNGDMDDTDTPNGNNQETENKEKFISIPTPSPDSACLPSEFKLTWEIIKDGEIVKEYKRDYNINFPYVSEYNALPGITTFRGNNFRNTASYGFADVKEGKLEEIWSLSIGHIDEWTGVGWNGQPSIVKWDEETKSVMNIFPEKKGKKDLKEVIYATLDGKIYFLDIDDGSFTRDPINVGYPFKGSVTVDPRGYPLLYAGQGIEKNGGKTGKIGFRIFSLIDQKELYFIDGMDKHAFRRWGAFDSGALIDPTSDTLVECGENGIVYTAKLNTNYDRINGSISIDPEIVKYRYKSSISKRLGIENSPVAINNYLYFIDNSGLFQCIDLNTMSPVWARSVNDDTDSSPALEIVGNSQVYVYTANEVDHQGTGGSSFMRKINALTGKLIWEKSVVCTYSSTNGGALASPVIGKHDIENLVIFNIAKTGKGKNTGVIYALDKNTGEEVWKVDMDYYSWSSPVDVYTKEGKSYLVVCDSGGFMRLLEGITGKELDKIPVKANVEGSPAIYENMIVVGTRGQRILGVKIK